MVFQRIAIPLFAFLTTIAAFTSQAADWPQFMQQRGEDRRRTRRATGDAVDLARPDPVGRRDTDLARRGGWTGLCGRPDGSRILHRPE